MQIANYFRIMAAVLIGVLALHVGATAGMSDLVSVAPATGTQAVSK